MRQIKTYALLVLSITLLVAGCKNNSNVPKPPKLKPTNDPVAPYIAEGDYTPDTGVVYKIIIGGDTCFVEVDSVSDETITGHYYQLVDSSNHVEYKDFTQDRHWKKQQKAATEYIYQTPEYESLDDALYRKPKYKVTVKRNIEYGQALGYWVSMPGTEDDSYLQILGEGIRNGVFRTTQSLTMDVYSPYDKESTEAKHPMILLLHGGGYYVGDKGDSLIVKLCRHFASLGYVAVSANYRLGFLPTKGEIARTGYMALQDAHAAMRYLVDNADSHGIDTAWLFVGGASAGSITALNLAFMRDENRPKSVTERKIHNLGTIASSGNDSKASFTIKGVLNMWGAMTDLGMMRNSNAAVVSFHGDADQVVPCDNGFPFTDISTKLGSRMFDRMYGSAQIDKRAHELGLHSTFYPFKDQGHSLHRKKDGSWNQKNFIAIRDKATRFFFNEMAGEMPILVSDSTNTRHYHIEGEVHDLSWQVEGGFITQMRGNDIWVVWRDEEAKQKLTASGRNAKGFGFNYSLNPRASETAANRQ